MKELLLLVGLLSFFGSSYQARILWVTPVKVRSHYSSQRIMLHELCRRGHQVVSISAFEEPNSPPGCSVVLVNFTSFWDALGRKNHTLFEPKTTFFGRQKHAWETLNIYTNATLHLETVRSFVRNDHSHFDLVVVEEFFQPIFTMFSYKYRAPLIFVSTFGAGHYINEYMGNSMELSYVPHEFIGLYGEFTFLERIKNTLWTVWDIIGRKYNVVEVQNGWVENFFGNLGDNLPHIGDLERNASMILLNTHYSMSTVRPDLPNVVQIGGVHIVAPKPVIGEFKEILDRAHVGVIYFSLGSNLDISLMPEFKKMSLLNALARLPQKVLLKWDSTKPLPEGYPNIHAFPWMPQNDILAHPNVLAFVTHGGLLSAQEAIYHGTPIVCIPFFGDQPLNCARSVNMGYGLQLSMSNINEEIVYETLMRIITETSFKERARELSLRFKDRPTSALETAIFWIEYVIRHKGADFIKSPRRNLPWYTHFTVEVALLVALTVYLFVQILRLLTNVILHQISQRRKKIKVE